MSNCTQCPLTKKDNFSHIGKTYYILPDLTIMCFRHWHQAGRPKYVHYGEHGPVQTKLIELTKFKAKGGTIHPAGPFVLKVNPELELYNS